MEITNAEYELERNTERTGGMLVIYAEGGEIVYGKKRNPFIQIINFRAQRRRKRIAISG